MATLQPDGEVRFAHAMQTVKDHLYIDTCTIVRTFKSIFLFCFLTLYMQQTKIISPISL